MIVTMEMKGVNACVRDVSWLDFEGQYKTFPYFKLAMNIKSE